MQSQLRKLAIVAAMILTPAFAAAAEVIYVDASAPSAPPGDGSSWQSAFNDLQAALAIAKPGDEIRIAQGTYKPAPPDGPRDATFNLIDGVIIQGGYAGVSSYDPDALDHEQFQTILSGDLNGDDPATPQMGLFSAASPAFVENSYQFVTADGTGAGTSVRGVTIRSGNGNGSPFPYWPVNPLAAGGGITCLSDAHLTLADCTLHYNRAWLRGGAIYSEGGSLELVRCHFVANSAFGNTDGVGGAIYTLGSTFAADCLFQSNNAGNAGGAFYGGGNGAITRFERCQFIGNYGHEAVGAISATAGFGSSQLIMIDCLIQGNGSKHMLGGVTATNARISNCIFNNNYSGFMGFGGALRIGSQGQVVNTLFTGNIGGKSVVDVGPGAHSLINCTIAHNTPNYAPSAVATSGDLVISNSIIWNNATYYSSATATPFATTDAGTLLINHSCIQNWDGSSGSGGTGNHGNDPRFVDPENGDYRLRANSPAIDGGNNAALPFDEFDLDQDGDTSEAIPFDLDWLPRIVNKSVDVGAYEFQGMPCRADVNGDSAVTADDLITLLLGWGACPIGQSCDSDLNLDGQVDIDDLLELLQGWGPCP